MKQLVFIDHSIRVSFITFLFVFLMSCQEMGKKNEKPNTSLRKATSVCDTSYYAKYTDPAIRWKIDEAKWNLYLYAAIDTPIKEDGSYIFKNPKYYASYPVVIDTLYTYKESIFMLFSFCIDSELLTADKAFQLGVQYVPESISLSRIDGKESRCIRWRGLADGDNLCITSLSEDEIKKMPKHFSNEQLKAMAKSTDRLAYPLNPVIVKYIESNQNDLNPWFINEAKKRGLIK